MSKVFPGKAVEPFLQVSDGLQRLLLKVAALPLVTTVLALFWWGQLQVEGQEIWLGLMALAWILSLAWGWQAARRLGKGFDDLMLGQASDLPGEFSGLVDFLKARLHQEVNAEASYQQALQRGELQRQLLMSLTREGVSGSDLSTWSEGLKVALESSFPGCDLSLWVHDGQDYLWSAGAEEPAQPRRVFGGVAVCWVESSAEGQHHFFLKLQPTDTGPEVPLVVEMSTRQAGLERTQLEEMRTRLESIAPLLKVSWSNWTLYQELYSRLRTHRSVLDSLGDAVLLADREGRLLGHNPAALSLFGLGSEGMEGKLLCDLLTLPNGAEWSEAIAKGTSIPSFQATISRSHQSPVEALVLNYSVNHPISWKGLWLTVMVRDITKQRELDDLRSDFTATLSHELRTPLTSMKGYLQTLMHRKARTFDMDKIQGIVSVINGQADQLQRLIQELLEAAKLRSQDLEIQPRSCNVEELLRDCLADAYNPKVRHLLECQPDCWAHCDPERIRSVIEHLLSNAQKYSLPGGTVEVGCASVSPLVRIWVRDEGVGIPLDQQEKIFEMYHRLDTGNRRTHYGIGVGLYIARKVVEGHGGRITVESAPGCGAVFTFTLPELSCQADSPDKTKGPGQN